MNLEFSTSIDEVRRISTERNYWFIRTYSGKTFTDFYERNYVGIGFNFVPNKLINDTQEKNIEAYSKLREFVENNSSYSGGEATKAANQLVYFQHEMNIGDYVIIPSENSDYIAVGELTSEVYLVDDKRTFQFKDGYEPFPEKRRKVKWKINKQKHTFLGELGNLFYSRQAISKVNHLAPVIESHVSSLFVIGDVGHFVIRIKQDESINAFHLSRFLNALTYFYTEVCKEHGVEYNEELYIKIKVQSKGTVALATVGVVGLLGLSTLFALSDNPEIHVQLGEDYKLDAKGDGGLQSWSRFLNESDERKMRMQEFQESKQHVLADTLSMESIFEDVAVIEADTLSHDNISDDIKENGKENDAEDNGSTH